MFSRLESEHKPNSLPVTHDRTQAATSPTLQDGGEGGRQNQEASLLLWKEQGLSQKVKTA